MKASGQRKGQAMQGISARGLLFAVLAISFLGLLGLSVSLLQAAWRAEDQQFATVEARLLAILEEDGLSGLAFELDRIDRALAPGGDRVEMAVIADRAKFESAGIPDWQFHFQDFTNTVGLEAVL